MKHFVDRLWLKEHLNDQNIRIVDCRFQLGNPDAGYRAYHQAHIEGAVYFHLEKDLSGKVEEHGGRHPLPKIEAFKSLLEDSGIHSDTIIVAYDDGPSAFATRLWWLLKYVGHDKVYILNGGYQGWKEAGFPVDSMIPTYPKTELTFDIQSQMYASYDEVKGIAETPHSEVILVDSREENRYLGLIEPIDKKAGHIPGAINFPWTDGLKEGEFKDAKEQEDRFKKIDKSRKVIVYCGSGVTATPNYLALKEAGFSNVKLYIGSFSDWVSYDENKVETGGSREVLED